MLRRANLSWAVVPAVLVLLAAAITAVLAVRTQNETATWVAHTLQVIARLESTLSALTTAETAQRAYLLTGEESELRAVAAARRQVEADLAVLGQLTLDNPAQQQRLPALRAAAQGRLQALHEASELRRLDRLEDALDILRGQGRTLMEAARSQIQAMRQEEDRLLQERLARAERAASLGVGATAGAGTLALVLLLSLYAISTQHATRLLAEQHELRRAREETQRKAEELRQANAQLQRAAAELELRVAERTAALADVNAELEGFAHTVAHDLRAPLRNIQGFATALVEDEAPRLSEQGAEYAQRLAASAVRLDGMITDLLAYSRLTRSRLDCHPVELGLLMQQVLQDLADDIRLSGADVRILTSLPGVLAHRTTLTQVLTNLMSNALKFMRPGTAPCIEISARCQAGLVALTIADNGIGIEPAHQERIFAVFERLHGQERYPGSGIGLAIVRKGMERMGGRVHVESAPGRGSRFTIELPAADREET